MAGALEDHPQNDPEASLVTANEVHNEVRLDFEGGGGRVPGESKPTSVRALRYRLGQRVLCELRQIETQLRFCFLRLHLPRRSSGDVTSEQADRSESHADVRSALVARDVHRCVRDLIDTERSTRR